MTYHHIPVSESIYDEIANGERSHFVSNSLQKYSEEDVIVFQEMCCSHLLLSDAATGRECMKVVSHVTVLPYLSKDDA